MDDFIASECVTGSGHRVAAGALFEAYEGWAEAAGLGAEERLGRTEFGAKVHERFLRRRARQGRQYVGVALRESVSQTVG